MLGPFLPCFAAAEPSAAVRPLVGQMTAWAAGDPEVAAWARSVVPTGEGGTALAGAVLVWAHLHGAVGLEVSGQFSGMRHEGATLLAAQIDMLADAFALDAATDRG